MSCSRMTSESRRKSSGSFPSTLGHCAIRPACGARMTASSSFFGPQRIVSCGSRNANSPFAAVLTAAPCVRAWQSAPA